MSTTLDESALDDELIRLQGVELFLVCRPTTALSILRMSSTTTRLSEALTTGFLFPGAAEAEATAAAEMEGTADSGSLKNPLPMDLTLHLEFPAHPVRDGSACCL